MTVNDKSELIKYDEGTGIFDIGDGIEQIHDKDITLNKINGLREKANLTTLGNYDYDILYKYQAKYYNNQDVTPANFGSQILKNLFPDLSDNDYILNNLMINAMNSINGNNIESFGTNESCGWTLYGLLFILIILIIIIYKLFPMVFANTTK